MPIQDRPLAGTLCFTSQLERARSGDREALDDLASRYYSRVEELVHRRLSGDFRRSRSWLAARFSTRDIVQDAFLNALSDLGAFRGTTEDSFVAYLAMVSRNLLLGQIRHHESARRDGRRSKPIDVDGALDAESSAPADELAAREMSDRIVQHLARLPQRDQLLFRARSEGTASFRELATLLGFGSESAARRSFFRVQASLLLAVSEDDEDRP